MLKDAKSSLQWLAGVKRKKLYAETPFKCCAVFSKRSPRMHRYDYEGKKSSSMIDFAWFLCDHSYEGYPYIKFI